jgi:hypothetical protein
MYFSNPYFFNGVVFRYKTIVGFVVIIQQRDEVRNNAYCLGKQAENVFIIDFVGLSDFKGLK